MRTGFILLALAILLGWSSARAEMWRTLDGTTFEAELRAVEGRAVLLANNGVVRISAIETLDDAAVARVATFLARPTPAVPQWAATTSVVGKGLRDRLQVLRDGKLVALDMAQRTEPEFYVVYFGAFWCGPCRRFSPRLKEAYANLQRKYPGRFEVIFVSSDEDAGEQLKYVREVGMPWPVLKFSNLGRVPAIERMKGRGIPCLSVLTRAGDLIFHSYRGEEYLGADHTLDELTALLALKTENSEAAMRARHRFAVLQHIQAAGTGDRGPKAFLIGFDPKRHQSLKLPEIQATLDINERGAVTSASFSPQLPTVEEFDLVREAEGWLFLPAVVAGKAERRTVTLPLVLREPAPAAPSS